VLPSNWNFRPGMGHRDIVGPIKIWHHYAEPPPALFDRDFGNALNHTKVEDLFPLRRGDDLRFGLRLLRHALGLRKRRPLFPDVNLSLRPEIAPVALQFESLQNSRSQLFRQLCKQIVRRSLRREPFVTCRPGERLELIAQFDAFRNSPYQLLRRLLIQLFRKPRQTGPARADNNCPLDLASH